MRIYGRSDELSRLVASMPDHGEAGSLVVVQGQAGAGKTALMHAACDEWQRSGALVVYLDTTPRSGDRGPFGIDMLLREVRARFEGIGAPGLVDALSAITRLRADAEDVHVPALLRVAIRSLFQRMTATRPVVLVVDSAHDFCAPLMLEAARRAGALAVSTCRSDEELTASVEELFVLADHVVDVGPLPDEVVERVLARAVGKPIDDRVTPALRASLGPLFGNVGTVLGAFSQLRESGRLSCVHNHLCLLEPDVPVPLPATHRLVERSFALGPPADRVLAMIVALGQFDMAAIAAFPEDSACEVDVFGQLLDDLVELGALLVDGEGRVTAVCPAFVEAVRAAVPEQTMYDVHTALVHAASLSDYAESDLPDSIARSGQRLELAEDAVDRLEKAARAALVDDPGRACAWLELVLAHTPGTDPRWPENLADALRSAVRAGRYTVLSRLISAYHDSPAAGPIQREDLAAAALLTALHTGSPTAPAVLRSLYGDGECADGPLKFEQWWFGAGVHASAPAPAGFVPGRWQSGTPLLRTEELNLLGMALTGDFLGCRDGLTALWTGRPIAHADVARLVDAGLTLDIPAVLRTVLGTRYGPPETGMMIEYHRLFGAFLHGRWVEALSACRAMEIHSQVVTHMHHRARISAAEISFVRGDVRQAEAWLASASRHDGFRLYQCWVRLRVAGTQAQRDALVEDILDSVHHDAPSGVHVGAGLALMRGLEEAVRHGRRPVAVRLLGAIEELHRARRIPHGEEHVLLAQALVNRNLPCAKAAAEMARAENHPMNLITACLVASELDHDPQPWLHEAYQVAKQLDAPHPKAKVLEQMRRAGVVVPRARAERAPYSSTELRIVKLLREGWTNRQIAGDIGVTEKTVESYLTRLFARTRCRSRVDLAAASIDGRITLSSV